MKNQTKSREKVDSTILYDKINSQGIESLTESEKAFVKESLREEIAEKKDLYPVMFQGKDYNGYETRVILREDANGKENLVELPDVDGDLTEINDLPEVKINEQYRNLFPVLSEELEKDGLLQTVLVDDFGFTHDGEKRRLLLGIDQIKALGKLEIVPVNSDFSNISSKFLSNETKETIIRDLHVQFKSPLTNVNGKYNFYEENDLMAGRSNHAFVKMCAKRYAISERTVYRWIDPDYFAETEKKRLEKKAERDKSKAERETKRQQEEVRKSANNELSLNNDSAIEYILQWVDVETPKISESEKIKLTALRDILNERLA